MHRKFIWLIILIGLLTFANCLFNDFVGDDEVLVVHNSFYDHWQNFGRLFQSDYITQSNILFEKKSGDFHSGSVAYRPFLSATYFLDAALWQKNPFGYHLTNVVLHLLNSILVYFLVYALTQNAIVAVFSSILFCVHPLKAEPVCAIAYRHDVLASFFVLLSVHCFTKYTQFQNRWRYYGGTILFYILAIFSKESAIVLPAILLFYDVCFTAPVRKINWRLHGVTGLISLFYIFAYYAVFPNSTLGKNLLLGQNWLEHIAASFRIFLDYIGWLLNPFLVKTFPPLYVPPLEGMGSWHTILGVILFFSLLLSIFRLIGRDRVLAFFIFWFLISFLPVSNIIPLANPMAHRFLYFPSIGLLTVIILLIYKLFSKRTIFSNNPRLILLLAALVISANVISTIFLNSCWRSNYSFARAAIEAYPEDPKAYSILGIVYFGAGMCQDATQAIKRSLELGIRDPRVYYMLGACEDNQQKAKDYFETAIHQLPRYAAPYLGLGKIYFNNSEYGTALTYFQQNTQLDPNLSGFAYLIRTHKKLNQATEARQAFENAQQELKNSEEISFLHDILSGNLPEGSKRSSP